MKIVLSLPRGKSATAGSLAVAAAILLLPPFNADALEFNDAFLKQDRESSVELKHFENGNNILPGAYDADIYANGLLVTRKTIETRADSSGKIRPVITVALLRDIGVNIKRLEQEERLPAKMTDAPLDVSSLMTGASSTFDVEQLSLQLSIPQAYMQGASRGYVSPTLWDDGVTAGFSNYQLNFNRNVNQSRGQGYYYLGLRNGLNIGGWRFRNDSSFIGGNGMPSQFTSSRNFVERDIRSLRSKLALGELYTQGEIFESVRFLGMQISSELGMRSDNENGYAPVVRGVARSNATVEVLQNGYVIHSTTVAPGAFEISDLYPSGSSGDFEVRITEADGSVRRYTQPYSYLPVMTRPGSMRYTLTGGEYRIQGGAARPRFIQGTLVYGISDNFTGYGGLLAAENYSAANLGLGVNTPIGGMSLDVTHSQSKTRNAPARSGQSLRLLYSKTLESTETTFTMMGYRYSTEGYRTLTQHVDELNPLESSNVQGQKNRITLNINQDLGNYGSLYVSADTTKYWNRPDASRRFQLGYSGFVSNVSYNLSISHTPEETMLHGSRRPADTQFNISLSIPLGDSTGSHRLYTNTVASTSGETQTQVGLSGYLDERNLLNYSIQANHATNLDSSGAFGLGWESSAARLGANYSQSRDDKHMDFTASGSLVMHSGGLTLGQSVGETFGIVQIPDVPDVGFDLSSSIKTDSRGYAILPSMQPYRYNWLTLNTQTLDVDTEITDSAKMVVPTRGAIVATAFDAKRGRRIQFEFTGQDRKTIPLGAQAFDDKGKLLGIVDNNTRLFVHGLKNAGNILIRWSEGECGFRYSLPPRDKTLAYERIPVGCPVAPKPGRSTTLKSPSPT